jgi:hypothetical protein
VEPKQLLGKGAQKVLEFYLYKNFEITFIKIAFSQPHHFLEK